MMNEHVYDAGEPCKHCQCTFRYRINNECTKCARLVAVDFYNYAICAMPLIGEFPDEWQQFMPWPMPTTKQAAIIKGRKFYATPDPCKKAGHVGVRLLNGKCYLCAAAPRPLTVRQKAAAAGEQWYIPDAPCRRCGQLAPRRVKNGQCKTCHPGLPPKPPSPRQQALKAGKQWYTPDGPCKYCGTLAPRRVNSGSCQECERRSRLKKIPPPPPPPKRLSARQKAFNEGRQWYDPDTPCPRCGQLAPRHVENSTCQGCRDKTARQKAAAKGLEIYRAAPCPDGHQFRLTETGECVLCTLIRNDRQNANDH